MMSAQRKVERGVAYLDRIGPGWEIRIDLDRLDLLDRHDCILGQLFGDFRNAPALPFLMGRHGFMGGLFTDRIKHEWVRVILARQALQAVKQRRLTAATEPLLARST